MSVFGKWMRKVRGARVQGAAGSDFDEEMRFHVEMETEKNVAAGMDREAARKRALIEFGNANDLKEQVRGELGWAWMGDFCRDLAHGARVLGRRRGFTASVVLTLGLCLGANTAFFATLENLVLQDLPFAAPDRLVEVYRSELGNSHSKLGGNLSLLNEYETEDELFESVSYFQNQWSNIQISGQGFRGNAVRVSPGFFDLLGLSVFRGEALSEDAGDGAVWISRSVWESVYGSDESLLGHVILIDGKAHRIAGVAPREAERAVESVSVFVKIDRSELLASPMNESLRAENEGTIWARLATGVSQEQAARGLSILEKRFQETASSLYRENNDESRVSVEVMTVQEVRTQWAGSRLFLLNAGALLVLVIGCVNVANLLLAQANARGEEFWVRRMLGAKAGRLVRQCVAEIALLVVVSLGVGMGFAFLGIRFLGSYSNELFRDSSTLEIGPYAVFYGGGIALVCLLVLGSLVGVRAVSASKEAENARSAVQSTPGKGSSFLRANLAVWQTAFTLALLIGGGLLIKSFYLVNNQDFGFDSDGVVTGRIHLVDSTYEDGHRKEAFKTELLERLSSEAGVEAVSLSSTIPTFGFPDQVVVKSDAKQGERGRRTFFSNVSPGHMKTLGIRLLEGRDFGIADEFGWQTPLLVDERFAEMLYPGESALGKRINLGRRPGNANNWPVIVGVVESTKQTALDGDDGMPMVYFPLKGSWVSEFSVLIKTSGSGVAALDLLEREVSRLDVSLPIYRSGTLDAVMAESLSGRRGMLWLCIGLGGVALVLSSIGVYGASAFRVSQRLREFAIRMAIGATEGRVISEHVMTDLRLVAIGLGLGLVLALVSSRFLASWLYGVERFDWQTYGGLSVVVALVYAASSYLPSRRGVSGNRVRL